MTELSDVEEAQDFHQALVTRSRQGFPAKRLVYLDQCVVSNMAKAKTQFWGDVRQDARAASSNIYPLTVSHRDESRRAVHSGKDIFGLATELSRGWAFNRYDMMRANEIVPAFGKFANLFFLRDPSALETPMLTRTPAWWVELGDAEKREMDIPQLQELAKLPEAPGRRKADWYYEQESLPNAEALMLERFFRKPLSAFYDLSDEDYMPGLPYLIPLRMFASLEKENESKARDFLMEFFASKLYLMAPSVNLQRCLWATMRAQDGKWKNSDFEDIRFASAVIPYVDAILVDGPLFASLTAGPLFDVRKLYPKLEIAAVGDLGGVRRIAAATAAPRGREPGAAT